MAVIVAEAPTEGYTSDHITEAPPKREETAMATDDDEPAPPAVLFALLDAAQDRVPAHRLAPFLGVDGSDAAGNNGLIVRVGLREVFLSDEDAGALIAGDYIDIATVGTGHTMVRILPRGLAADRDR